MSGVSIYDAYISPVVATESAAAIARRVVLAERAAAAAAAAAEAGTHSQPRARSAQDAIPLTGSSHFDADAIQRAGPRATHARQQSVAQRVQELGALEVAAAAEEQQLVDALAGDAYFTPLSSREHFPPPAAAPALIFELGVPPRVDAATLFAADAIARKAATDSAASSHALPGKAMKRHMDVRPVSAPRSKPQAVPASLTGMPLSFFGVSDMLTPGQARIQQKWLAGVGVDSNGSHADGPMRPRSRPVTATVDRSRPVTATETDASTSSQAAQPDAPAIPSLALPIHTWQPAIIPAKPGIHTHEALSLQSFEFVPMTARPPSSRPVSSSTARPGSSTSRSNRTQQASARPPSARPESASLGASRSRPATAGNKATSATPISSSIPRGTATFRTPSMQLGDLLMAGINASASGAVTVPPQPVPQPASRPSSAPIPRLPISATPNNIYARPFVTDEKDDLDQDDRFEDEYQRWMAHEKANGVGGASRPQSGVRPSGSATSRTSRPQSSARSRPQSGVSSGSQTSRTYHRAEGITTTSNQYLQHYDPQTQTRVSDPLSESGGAQFQQRAKGLLLTTRARPPFSARPVEIAHSSLPLSALALRPNAGFQTELVVAHDMLREFGERAREDEPHFYSPTVFWDYKLSELLRATEEEQSASADGARITGDQATKGQRVVAATDHAYPNTTRTLCASAILKQLVPTLIVMPSKDPNAATNARALLDTALDLLHRSIYQPPSALIPPCPPAHVLDADLGRAASNNDAEWGQPTASKRAKRIAEVGGSGYAQRDTINARRERELLYGSQSSLVSSFNMPLSDDSKAQLLRNQYGGGSAAVGFHPDPHAYAIPFFLSTKYLYESNQLLIGEGEKTGEKIMRVESQIDRINRKVSRRVCRVTFHIWRAYVRMQKQKENLSTYLTKTALGKQSRCDPFTIFKLWKFWAARGRIKRHFRSSLKEMQLQIRDVSTNLQQRGAKDTVALQGYLQQIQHSFQSLESESKFSGTPVDIFSPMGLSLLLQRYQSQVDIIDSLHYVDLLPLCDAYSKSSDLSLEVDLILNEIGRIGNHELAEVRTHLLAKLDSMARREASQESAMMQALLSQSGEDFVLTWVNRHLSETQSGLKLEDLSALATSTDVYLGLLKSVAPHVVDSVTKATADNVVRVDPDESGHTPTSEAEARLIASSRLVLEVCSTMGCLPVISLEEFLAHPSHAAHLDRLANEKLRVGGVGAKAAAMSSAAAAAKQAAPGAFDISKYHSTHPGDAGLTAVELDMPVDAHGQPLHLRRHMFDDVAPDLSPVVVASVEPKPKTRGGAGRFNEASVMTGKYSNSSGPANPHLHLCLLTALFLQRPALPITSTNASPAFTKDGWIEATRVRIAGLTTEWDAIKSRRDVSLFDIQAFLSSVSHIGLEIDVLRSRSQRRATSFDQMTQKMEDLLWTLQRRKATTTASGSSTTKGAEGVRRANISAELPSYSEIPMSKLLDVLVNKESSLRDYADIKTIIGRHYGELASVFRHYSSLSVSHDGPSHAGANINFTEFMILIVDCHLHNGRKINKGVLNMLFTRCALSVRALSTQSTHTMPFTDADRLEHTILAPIEDASPPPPTTQPADDADEDEEADPDDPQPPPRVTERPLALSQAGLFEAFIRLSTLKYSQVTSIPERVRRLIEMDVLPSACRLQLDEFRTVLSQDRVKRVFTTHSPSLLVLFHHYAKHEESTSSAAAAAAAASRGKLMNRAGFMRMVQESRLLAPSSTDSRSTTPAPNTGLPLRESDLNSIFAQVLRLPDQRTVREFEVTFPVFLEILCAIAAFKSPDPYSPMAMKLDNFIACVLLPPLKAAVRRLAQLNAAAGHQTNAALAASAQPTPTATPIAARR